VFAIYTHFEAFGVAVIAASRSLTQAAEFFASALRPNTTNHRSGGEQRAEPTPLDNT
jgi:hypothetical protein